MIIGTNIKNLRLKRKMTQKHLADKVGVTKSAISLIEIGNRNPSFHLAEKIAKELKTSLKKLF